MINQAFKVSALALATMSLVSANSHAQSSNTLEEIVVTAQKRSESLQEVPVAISAFTANTLEKKGITSTDDLTIVTPGLQAGRQTSSSTPYLRGVGTQSSAAGDENSIAMYVDGVYAPSARSNTMSFNNIERIEVLKGPQGTLFGRNATGGLIHVITKDPQYDTSGKVEVSYGSYDTSGVKLYATGGLSETVAVDFAAIYEHQDEGWGTNRVTGRDVNLSETQAYRSKILFEPNDDTQIKVGINYSNSEGDIGMTRQVAPGALGGDGLGVFLGCTAPAAVGGLGLTEAECAPLAASLATTYTGDWYDSATARTTFSNAEDQGATLHVEHSFDGFDFLSISAYQYSDYEQLMVVDASAGPFQDAVLNYDVETYSQEFQVTSSSGERLEWILGLFFMDSTSAYKPFSLFTPFSPPPAPTVTATNSQDTRSISAYFQGGYDLTDATKITLGLRVTQDERDMQANLTVFDPSMGFIPVQAELSEEWVEPTWRLALDHQLEDSTLLYASYSRGFKSGVYNLAGLPADPVDPEILDAFEIGSKSDLLDSSLRLNTSLFFYQYSDVQLQRVEGGSAFLVNAAEAEIMGLEIDATWLATEALTLTAGLALTDSEYSDYPDATYNTPTGFGGNLQASADASGNDVIRTPEFTLSIGADYAWYTSSGEIAASVHYYYNDGFYWEPENRLRQDAYEIVNLELAWSNPEETWQARVYAKNLLDEEYSYYSNSSQAGDAISAAPPRTFGVALGYNF
ncbi:MAG: TonB-dependent receptor [Gammaproteobacteria bacterium]|nr:TonB-dependent receptor [Gammaproteobacteria bacterium]